MRRLNVSAILLLMALTSSTTFLSPPQTLGCPPQGLLLVLLADFCGVSLCDFFRGSKEMVSSAQLPLKSVYMATSLHLTYPRSRNGAESSSPPDLTVAAPG